MENNTINTNQGYTIIELGAYVPPKSYEDKRKEWVKWGEEDDYYQMLIDLYVCSPTNSRCIKGIADLIYGNGLEAQRADRNLESYIELKTIFMPSELKKVILDLKLLGKGVFQLVPNKAKTKIVKAYHWPADTVRSGKANEDGDIETYYYAPDWSKKRGLDPKPYKNFELLEGSDRFKEESFLVIQDYCPSYFYYTPPDYDSGIDWAMVEKYLGPYHVNSVLHGFSGTKLINFNQGEPDKNKKDEIERGIKGKFTGVTGDKIIISWNDSKETAATIDDIPVTDAHSIYEYLTKEASSMIMRSHGITSPMLLGIKDNTGLGNNADELRTASILFENTVIKPFQNIILDKIQYILNANGVNIDLYFKTLQPVEFTDVHGLPMPQAEKEKELGLSAVKKKDMTLEDEQEWIEQLAAVGEVVDLEEWEEISEVEIDTETEPTDITKLTAAFANPDAKSADDKGIYKIRYRYGPNRSSDKSRIFCKTMISERNRGVVYRREDIDSMGRAGVNGEFSPKGKSTYDIWKFKGGAYCHHAWFRVTFRRKKMNGGKVKPLTETEKDTNTRDMRNYDAVGNASANAAGVPFNPPAWNTAKTKPIDMPNRGKLN